MDLNDAAQALEKLGHPNRLAIVRLLVRAGPDGLAVGELQKSLKIPASTLSHHLSHLLIGGLISRERQGRALICSANYDRLQALVTMLTENCCVGVAKRPRKKTRTKTAASV